VSWLEVGALESIPARGARQLSHGGLRIAVFRTGDDRVFALLDRCPHREGPLSQGIVHGHCVTCPLHDWVIELDSGKAAAPDEGETPTYPVRVEDGIVYVATERPGTRRTRQAAARAAAP
jgi:nitrite reductase [NAD(P)H] small subunit